MLQLLIRGRYVGMCVQLIPIDVDLGRYGITCAVIVSDTRQSCLGTYCLCKDWISKLNEKYMPEVWGMGHVVCRSM